MWFELIPPSVIIVVAMSIPGYAVHYGHKFFNGNAYNRRLCERWDYDMYMRDVHLTGNAYKVKTLDDLPDETPSQLKK